MHCLAWQDMTTKVHAASSVIDFYNVAKSLLNDLKMVTKDSEWVNATNKQLDAEAGKKNSVSKKLSFTDGLDIHAPVEPIPDNDWVGETWGLFWPDQELEDKSEDPTKFVKVDPINFYQTTIKNIFRNIMKIRLRKLHILLLTSKLQ